MLEADPNGEKERNLQTRGRNTIRHKGAKNRDGDFSYMSTIFEAYGGSLHI